MAREIGTAFAVLAIYVLTLLLPLHQAAGLQRDLAKAGFETVAAWSICAPLAQDDDGNPSDPAAIKCPAAGIAKHDFVGTLPAVVLIEAPSVADVVRFANLSTPHEQSLPDHTGQSRAPPVTV